MRPQQYKNGECCSGVVEATMARTANGWGSATERSVRQRRRPRRHDLGFMAGLVALLVATVVAATGLMGAGASRVFGELCFFFFIFVMELEIEVKASNYIWSNTYKFARLTNNCSK